MQIILIAAIITGLKALLGMKDMALTEREEEKLYLSNRDQGDPMYQYTVLIPSLICKYLFINIGRRVVYYFYHPQQS